MAVEVKLDQFAGPLDLLLQLVEKNELDICQISLVKVADQFIAVMQERAGLRVAGEFLVMASRLVVLKSRVLLSHIEPDRAPEEDSDAEDEESAEHLVKKLAEYKKYKELADQLEVLADHRNKLICTSPIDLTNYLSDKEFLRGVTVSKLCQFFSMLIEAEGTAVPPDVVIEREHVSVKVCMAEIISHLSPLGELIFTALVADKKIEYRIGFFLALLELIKQQEIICKQADLFAEISITGVGIR